MSTVAQAARPSRTTERGRARRQAWSLGGGVAWIVFLAILLAGVVAVNVSVLRLNLELDQVGRERAELRGDLAQIRSELSSVAATSRIEKLAQKDLGMVRADPDETTFVRLGR